MTCFDIAEVGEALVMPRDALDGFIRAGVLAVVEVGCRRLVEAEAVLASVPEPRRQEVRDRLDAIELRRCRG